MQETLFIYKKRFLTFALIIGYAYLHVKLTGIYVEIPLDKVIDFNVRLPFAQRILIPGMGQLLIKLLPFEVEEVFFLLEIIWDSLLFFSLYYLLKEYFPKNSAQLLSWLFMLLLPLMTVVNYRYTAGKEATFYYTYDTASMVFIFAGFLLCLRKQWELFIPLVFLATLNRESSFLILLLIPLLHLKSLNEIKLPFFLSVVTYLLTRGITLWFIAQAPGNLAEIYYQGTNITHFSVNIMWLLSEANFIFLIFSFCGVSILWFVFFDYIPERFKPLRYLSYFYFLCILIVGNLMEARVLEEIVALLYLPVCVAISRWLAREIIVEKEKTWLFYINRNFILVSFVFILLAGKIVNLVIKGLVPY
ncbi:hypothetical protein Lade_0891 [Legionella adelaidensis]|uniref:Uncharacterized protein n=1 Tax=Legionella adelaidensis TaxID=45056 RepID=A0A0W0R5D7_9GAMM|nr:hypothetical protein [Legionella adelaidensis]KTC66233.1 hypothetical protein Lade_0891 [Legionella adelaidensis]